MGLQLQRGDQPDLGARGHHEGYSKGHGSRNPSRNPGPLNGEGGGGGVRGKVLTGKEGDFCYLKFLLCT